MHLSTWKPTTQATGVKTQKCESIGIRHLLRKNSATAGVRRDLPLQAATPVGFPGSARLQVAQKCSIRGCSTRLFKDAALE